MTGRLGNLEKIFSECEKDEVEFVLVHDEQDSTTQTEIEALLKKFENLDIKPFRKTFNSPGLARNFGTNHSTGRWFCFSDADDLPQISKLVETCLRCEENDAQVGIGSILVVTDGKDTLIKGSVLKGGNSSDIASFAASPAFTRFVFKSEVFKSVDFPATKMGEDQVYLGRTKFLDHKLYFSDELLYIYFTNQSNQATKNRTSLSELPFTMELLNQNLLGSSAQMRLFTQTQIMKISITCLKHRINSHNAIISIANLIQNSPIKSLLILYRILMVKNARK
jgi:glycosyltransferase involved in cell wall biosynthesis